MYRVINIDDIVLIETPDKAEAVRSAKMYNAARAVQKLGEDGKWHDETDWTDIEG